jgi:hypothetical protein
MADAVFDFVVDVVVVMHVLMVIQVELAVGWKYRLLVVVVVFASFGPNGCLVIVIDICVFVVASRCFCCR